MAVRTAVRLAGATAVAVLVGLVGPAVDAQDQPAAPAEPTAAAEPSIRDALTGESTDVTGSAAGGFNGNDSLDVTLTLENHTAAPIVLTVPRGALFATDDDTEQTAVTVGPADEAPEGVEPGVDPTITVDPGEHTFALAGFCAQHLDSGPNDVVPMTWAGVAAEPLTTVLTNIASAQPSTDVAQHAVWWVTDVPVLPVPAEIAPLLEGVDAEAFAAHPERVVADERYVPAWGRDQALNSDDPFGESPFAFNDPSSSDNPFAVDSGDGGGSGSGIGLLLLGVVLACIAVSVVVAKAAGRQTPAVARTSTGATPAGWHPDPQQPGQLRYWDGSAWTSSTRAG